MHLDASAQPQNPLALLASEDEDLAGRSAARLLITAPAPEAVESLARRIHGASSRAGCPFVRTRAADLPLAPHRLRETCSDVLDAAAGGTVLIVEVEEMSPIVQDVLIDLLAELESARAPSAAVRLVFGTTVSLLDRVGADAFSERLFYRLNMIHLMTMPVAAAMTLAR
jgi:DNA-binding NtrC family response regulator